MSQVLIEDRKRAEREFHNRLRDPSLRENPAEYRRLTANKKYYAITASSTDFYMRWLTERCHGKRVLDYGCGDGRYSRMLASRGATVVGIDISDVSIQNCRRHAIQEGVSDRASFEVMDCEALEFPNARFDLVCETGVLHHLDLGNALAEISRVLTPEGQAICYEALGHNPVFQAYRRLTPHLRTAFETEHILRLQDLSAARRYFGHIEVRFFHLTALAAVPFRHTRLFSGLARVLNRVDDIVLRVPGVRELAWVAIFVLSQPGQGCS